FKLNFCDMEPPLRSRYLSAACRRTNLEAGTPCPGSSSSVVRVAPDHETLRYGCRSSPPEHAVRDARSVSEQTLDRVDSSRRAVRVWQLEWSGAQKAGWSCQLGRVDEILDQSDAISQADVMCHMLLG